jgi:undecaprenyl-diphosphatase
MVMDNRHLFELINASPGMGHLHLVLATALAEWVIYLVPLVMTVAWVRGDHASRRELLEMLLSALMALTVAQVVTHVWPQPRPFQLHLGTQYLQHGTDPGMPSDHVTVFWSLAFAALLSRQREAWGFPLLAIGLAVGWSRVYLGVHFPYDVLGALPVALAGVALAHAAGRPLLPAVARILYFYDRVATLLRERFRHSPGS